MSSSGEMICGSGGVETFSTLVERAGDVKTGARDGLESTLGDGATRMVWAVLAGKEVTVRAVWVDQMVAPLGRLTRILRVVGTGLEQGFVGPRKWLLNPE